MQDIAALLTWGGLALVALLVFAESGLLIGLFLPGDSLVFTAGVLAADGVFDLRVLLLVILAATIIGDQLGYYLGRRFGPKLARSVPPEAVEKAETFFRRFGWSAVALARFIPILRTLIPFLAGASRYSASRFTSANIVGASLWTLAFCLAGYWVGERIPSMRDVVVVVALCCVTIAVVVGLARYVVLKRRVGRSSVSRRKQ